MNIITNRHPKKNQILTWARRSGGIRPGLVPVRTVTFSREGDCTDTTVELRSVVFDTVVFMYVARISEGVT